MDLSLSSSHSSFSPYVQSPLPIRSPAILHKNKLLSSFPLYDFIEETKQISHHTAIGLSLHKSRSCYSEGYISNKEKSLEVEEKEGRGLYKRASSKSLVMDIRPPSRARNPQVHDKEFIKMNISMRLQGASVELNMETREIEITEHA